MPRIPRGWCTCDGCGFAPFGDDTSTTYETAFAEIRARLAGTQLATQNLGLGTARSCAAPFAAATFGRDL